MKRVLLNIEMTKRERGLSRSWRDEPRVLARIASNVPASLGLRLAVYFYNGRGKHSRFLFLGVVALYRSDSRIIMVDSLEDSRKHVET
jgi:hypothetical protein